MLNKDSCLKIYMMRMGAKRSIAMFGPSLLEQMPSFIGCTSDSEGKDCR